MQTGDKIKTFKDTDVQAYVNLIHQEGFRCKIYRDYLLVTEPMRKPVDRMATARTITQIRRKHKMNRDDMSQLLGVKRDTIWKWETGLCLPDRYNQERLKELMGWEGVIYE